MERELLQERLDAKKAMEKAQEKLDKAEEALVQGKQANGIQLENPIYKELKQEVES